MRTSPSCLACPREVRSGPLVRVSEEVVNNAIRPGGSRRLSDMYGGADTNGGGGRPTTTAQLPRDYAKTQSVIVRWMADRKQLNQTDSGALGLPRPRFGSTSAEGARPEGRSGVLSRFDKCCEFCESPQAPRAGTRHAGKPRWRGPDRRPWRISVPMFSRTTAASRCQAAWEGSLPMMPAKFRSASTYASRASLGRPARSLNLARRS